MKFVRWLFKTAAIIMCSIILLAVILNKITDICIKTSDKVFVVMNEDEVEITDKADIDTLKDIFLSERSGSIFGGESICGFGMEYSVKLTNSRFSPLTVWVCPAMDKCAIFDIQGKLYEVPEENRRNFESIVGKYGMTFPHI